MVKNLIKQNRYTETYRVEDEDHHPFFLKLFILKNMPAKLINPETGIVFEIEYSKQLTHKNLVNYVDSGTVNLERGECSYYLTNYFTGELLAEKLYREGKIGEEEALAIFRGIPEIIDLGHASKPCAGKVYFDMNRSPIGFKHY